VWAEQDFGEMPVPMNVSLINSNFAVERHTTVDGSLGGGLTVLLSMLAEVTEFEMLDLEKLSLDL